MRRHFGLVLLLLPALGCGSNAPAAAPTETEEADPIPVAEPEAEPSALSIPELWTTRAPVVSELVDGEVIEVEESWSIGMLGGDGLSGLSVRSRPNDREAAYAAGSERLEDHDARYSAARTAMSAVVNDVSIRLAIPGFSPGQLDVQASVGATPAEVVAQCPRLAPLADELAGLEGWPAQARSCSRTRSASEADVASARLRLEEIPALAWLHEHRFAERASEDVDVEGRVFERAGAARATAHWHASRNELEILVGDVD